MFYFNEQIGPIQSDIDDQPELKHEAELMRCIPGVGHRASAQFLAYTGNIKRFKREGAGCVIGVRPKQKSVRHLD